MLGSQSQSWLVWRPPVGQPHDVVKVILAVCQQSSQTLWRQCCQFGPVCINCWQYQQHVHMALTPLAADFHELEKLSLFGERHTALKRYNDNKEAPGVSLLVKRCSSFSGFSFPQSWFPSESRNSSSWIFPGAFTSATAQQLNDHGGMHHQEIHYYCCQPSWRRREERPAEAQTDR